MLQACPRQLEGGAGVPDLAPAWSCRFQITAADVMKHVCSSSLFATARHMISQATFDEVPHTISLYTF